MLVIMLKKVEVLQYRGRVVLWKIPVHGYHCEVTFVFTSYQFRSEEFTKHLIKKNKLEILFKGLEMFRQEYKKSSSGLCESCVAVNNDDSRSWLKWSCWCQFGSYAECFWLCSWSQRLRAQRLKYISYFLGQKHALSHPISALARVPGKH